MKTDNADKIDELPGWSSNPYDVMAHPETPVSENTADNRITANTDFIANSEPHPMAIDPKQITMQEVPQPDVNPMAVDPATITMSEVNAPQSAVHPMAIDPATITMPEVAAPQPQATQQPQPSTNPPAQMGWPEKAARWVKGAPLEMPGYLLSGIGKGAEAVLPDSIGKPVSTALQAPLLAGHNLAGTASPYENQEWINQANQQFGAAAPYITGFAHGFLNSYVPETQTEHGTWTSAGQSAAELAGMAANMGGMSTKAAVKVLDHIAPGVLNKLLGSAAISMGAYGAQTNAPDIGTTIKNTAMGALMGKLFAVGGNVANAAISKLIPSAPEWLAKMIATYALGTAGGASEHADSWKERLRNMMMGGPVFLAAHAVNPYSYMKDSATAEDLTKTNQVVPPPDAVSDLQTGLDKMNALDNEYGAQQGNEGQGGTDTGAAEQLPSMLGQGNEGQTPKDPELIISLKQLGYSDDEINAMSHADAEYINLENPYQYPQALKEMGIDTTPEGKTEAETAPESYAALKGLGYPDSEIVDMDAGRARDIIAGQVIYKPEAVDSANNMAEKPHEQSDTNNYSANNSAKLEDSQQAIDNSPAPNEPETTGTGVEPQEGLEAAHAGDDGSTATSEGQTTDKQKQLEALGVKLQPPITTEAIQKQLENLGIKQEKGHNQEDSYPIKVKYIAKTGGSQRAEDTMSYKAAIERLFNAVAEKIGSMHRLILGPVSEENADAIRQAGSEKNKDFDVSGYRHSIDNSFVNHALKEHGDPKTEEPRGLIAITKEDIARIPEIVNDYDKVEYIGKTKLGKDVFLYTKRINGEVYYYEEIRQGKKELAGTTLFKKKATGTGDMPPLEAASPSTSETLTASPSSTSTIPQKSDTGQENPGQFALKEGARPSENPTRPVDLDQTYRDILDNLKKTLGPNVKLETYEGPRPPGVTEDVLREGMAKHGISGNPDEYPPIRGMYTHELGEDGKWYHVIRLATAENMADISNHEAFHGIQKILELTGRQ
ncbi:MAG: hypothetical protein HQK97_10345, partial [Nitrospirae bacterium]|nr:hypothetical protein [Nitrospirota bacterium]